MKKKKLILPQKNMAAGFKFAKLYVNKSQEF